MLAKTILEEFKLVCELRRLCPRTIKGYYNSTLLFLTWLEQKHGMKHLEDVRPQHIKLYIQYRKSSAAFTSEKQKQKECPEGHSFMSDTA